MLSSTSSKVEGGANRSLSTAAFPLQGLQKQEIATVSRKWKPDTKIKTGQYRLTYRNRRQISQPPTPIIPHSAALNTSQCQWPAGVGWMPLREGAQSRLWPHEAPYTESGVQGITLIGSPSVLWGSGCPPQMQYLLNSNILIVGR